MCAHTKLFFQALIVINRLLIFFVLAAWLSQTFLCLPRKSCLVTFAFSAFGSLGSLPHCTANNQFKKIYRLLLNIPYTFKSPICCTLIAAFPPLKAKYGQAKFPLCLQKTF